MNQINEKINSQHELIGTKRQVILFKQVKWLKQKENIRIENLLFLQTYCFKWFSYCFLTLKQINQFKETWFIFEVQTSVGHFLDVNLPIFKRLYGKIYDIGREIKKQKSFQSYSYYFEYIQPFDDYLDICAGCIVKYYYKDYTLPTQYYVPKVLVTKNTFPNFIPEQLLITPDNFILLVSLSMATIIKYDYVEQKFLKSFFIPQNISGTAISPTGKIWAISFIDNKVFCINNGSQMFTKKFYFENPISIIVSQNKSERIIVLNDQNQITCFYFGIKKSIIWTTKMEQKDQLAYLVNVNFGIIACVQPSFNKIYMLNFEDGSIIQTIEKIECSTGVVFHNKQNVIFTYHQNEIKILSKNGEKINNLAVLNPESIKPSNTYFKVDGMIVLLKNNRIGVIDYNNSFVLY